MDELITFAMESESNRAQLMELLSQLKEEAKEEVREEKKVFSIAEVAELLKLSPRTIYNYVRADQLHAVKVGKSWYIQKESLDAFLSTGTEKMYLSKLRRA